MRAVLKVGTGDGWVVAIGGMGSNGVLEKWLEARQSVVLFRRALIDSGSHIRHRRKVPRDSPAIVLRHATAAIGADRSRGLAPTAGQTWFRPFRLAA